MADKEIKLQKNNAQHESPLSLPQQAYVLASSLRSVIYNMAVFLVIVISYFILGVLFDDPLCAEHHDWLKELYEHQDKHQKSFVCVGCGMNMKIRSYGMSLE